MLKHKLLTCALLLTFALPSALFTSVLNPAYAKNKLVDEVITAPGERALQRWQALIEGDWEKAYSFAPPSYRKAYDQKQFKGNFGNTVVWKDIELLGVEPIDEISANVMLKLSVLFFPDAGGEMLLPSVITERWLLQEKQWWHTPK